MRVDLVHGIHTSENKKAFPALISPFFREKGFASVEHYYGHIFAIQTRWKNPKILEELKKKIPQNSIYVGHSNGCTLGWMLAEAGVRFRGMVLVNPALDRNKVVSHAKFVHVYYNSGDSAVALSRLLAFHPWGAMGKYGPSFRDPRYKNFDTGNVSGMPRVSGHSAIYTKKENREAWGKLIVQNVLDELTGKELEEL